MRKVKAGWDTICFEGALIEAIRHLWVRSCDHSFTILASTFTTADEHDFQF
jgi:hypothetical protein